MKVICFSYHQVVLEQAYRFAYKESFIKKFLKKRRKEGSVTKEQRKNPEANKGENT